MPIYEYLCPECNTKSEELRTVEGDGFGRCLECNHRTYRVPSQFCFKFHNPFTKDGEGFSSVTYPPDEYRRRIATNAMKDDVYHRDFE